LFNKAPDYREKAKPKTKQITDLVVSNYDLPIHPILTRTAL